MLQKPTKKPFSIALIITGIAKITVPMQTKFLLAGLTIKVLNQYHIHVYKQK
jgi:hypothetical protein